MSKIRIKNFGPIKKGFGDKWIYIKKVTVFIGNQGSGKSTVAKVISTLMWMEKAINRGDLSANMSFIDFFRQFAYQNLSVYFQENTIIDYVGDRYSILYNKIENPWPIIKPIEKRDYVVPKIMYVPAERNFLSVIKNATGVKGLPEPLFEFAEELKIGQSYTKEEEIALPINGVRYKYESKSDSSFIIGDDFNIPLLVASSGFQSLVPLFLVSKNLAEIIKSGSEINAANINVDQSIRMNKEIADIMLNLSLTDEDKLMKVREIKARFQNKAFINIVEEPEQNLFPISQQQLLNDLLKFNNMNEGNKLIMTTHSPYLINYLTLAIKADSLKGRILEKERTKEKLNAIVPLNSTVAPNDLVIYELDEKDGTINKLGNFEGIPSDNNYLNMSLGKVNQLFDSLLEIEEGL